MSKIVYKPHCEQCGSLIKQNVQYRRITFEGDYHRNSYLASRPALYEFYPYRCEVCGAVFDSAEVRPPKEVEEFRAESEK